MEYSGPPGRKEKKMLKKKEKEECVKDVMENRAACPIIIGAIAQGVSDYLEFETEMGTFLNDEDDQLADLLLMLHNGANYREAVALLRLVFGVTGNEGALALLSLVHSDNGEKTEEQFMNEFMFRSPRCRFREIVTSHQDEDSGEEQ